MSFDIVPRARVIMPIRRAAFAPGEEVSVDEAEGRICGMTVTCCQPSVPIAVSGEEITREIILLLKRYGIRKIEVINAGSMTNNA